MYPSENLGLYGWNACIEMEEPFKVMAKIAVQMHHPLMLRERVFLTECLFDINWRPTANPFWICFGYDLKTDQFMGRPPDYDLSAGAGCLGWIDEARMLQEKLEAGGYFQNSAIGCMISS